jgi:hypothetical protein
MRTIYSAMPVTYSLEGAWCVVPNIWTEKQARAVALLLNTMEWQPTDTPDTNGMCPVVAQCAMFISEVANWGDDLCTGMDSSTA